MSSQTTPSIIAQGLRGGVNVLILSPVETDSNVGLREVEFSNNNCCFWLPFFKTRSDDTIWERISTSTTNENQESGLFEKGLNVFKKVREWSELVAGPKWKTFIRRFNKNNKCNKAGKFQYDPLSYAMNFDEGLGGQERQFEDDDRLFRGFSARYAALAGSTKGMSCGKEAAPPVLI
ncbi:hypothetical protein LIER_30990 [Lithospermum erythrorhizon]|uniref:Uncharacterized protein n=1 Tax=Lithospermum erythrorhizon TaxID=34254 RepID=A0AAV3RVF1_LITER